MSKKLCKQVISGSKEQEIIMREVLGGLEEIATMLSYNPWPGDFEIIAVYTPDEERDPAFKEEVVIKSKPVQGARPRADVISYQRLKERLLKSA
jgi:hypothetical protein